MIQALMATGGALSALFGLVLTCVGGIVVVRWVWRKALGSHKE